jgi:hypothetical protein
VLSRKFVDALVGAKGITFGDRGNAVHGRAAARWRRRPFAPALQSLPDTPR